MDDLMQKLQSVLNDKESMKQLSELAAMLGAEQNGEPPEQQSAPPPPGGGSAPDFLGDIPKLMQLSGAVSQAGKGDKNIALLLALRPLLKEENQHKLDRAVRLLRMMSLLPLLRESGILGGDLLGGL